MSTAILHLHELPDFLSMSYLDTMHLRHMARSHLALWSEQEAHLWS